MEFLLLQMSGAANRDIKIVLKINFSQDSSVNSLKMSGTKRLSNPIKCSFPVTKSGAKLLFSLLSVFLIRTAYCP